MNITKTCIKSNIFSKYRSVIAPAHETSLFHEEHCTASGIYLEQHQTNTIHHNHHEIIIMIVMAGSGELRLQDNGDALSIPLLHGDVFIVPPYKHITLLNTAPEQLMITKIAQHNV